MKRMASVNDVSVKRSRECASLIGESEDAIPPSLLDELFNTMDFSEELALMEPTDPFPQPTVSLIKMQDPVKKRDLGESLYLSTAFFKDKLFIHVRKFVLKENVLIPTKTGVSFDTKTLWDLYCKIHLFNSRYASSSFIANDYLAVFKHEDEIILQQLKSHQCIQLSSAQFEMLKDYLKIFIDDLNSFLFEKYLPQLIQQQTTVLQTSETNDEDDALLCRLLIVLENHLSFEFYKELFQCEGCIVDHGGQLRHACITVSEEEKFTRVGDQCICICNLPALAKEFVTLEPTVTKSFLENLDIKLIQSLLYKKPE